MVGQGKSVELSVERIKNINKFNIAERRETVRR
jgi:hypothetical protein